MMMSLLDLILMLSEICCISIIEIIIQGIVDQLRNNLYFGQKIICFRHIMDLNAFIKAINSI